MTHPAQSSLRILPSDPLTRNVPGSAVKIIFHDYTIALHRADCERCVEAATGDILAHRDRIYSKIGTPREYAWGTVELTIIPADGMRWVDMTYLGRSLEAWLKVYDAVDMNFDVVVNGVGTVGTGRLGNVI